MQFLVWHTNLVVSFHLIVAATAVTNMVSSLDLKQRDAEQIEYDAPSSHMDDEALKAEEKALVRKIDLYLLPTIWLMYLLSYMDRTK